MNTLLVTTFALFTLCAVAAFWPSISKVWSYVDLFYYPLSAIGVILLFAASDTDRRNVTLRIERDSLTARISRLEEEKPQLDVRSAAALISSSTEILQTIPQLAAVCVGLGYDPKCVVAEHLSAPVKQYLAYIPTAGANEDANSSASRVTAACTKAQLMLQTIRDTQAISPLVADELVAHYAEAVAKGYGQMDYDGARKFVDTFEQRAARAIDTVRPYLSSADNAKYGNLVLDQYTEEAKDGNLILYALIPCMFIKVQSLSEFEDWTKSKSSLDDNRKRLEERARQLRERADPTVQRISDFKLMLWPYFIISALALKFGKGIAHVEGSIRAALAQCWNWILGRLPRRRGSRPPES